MADRLFKKFLKERRFGKTGLHFKFSFLIVGTFFFLILTLAFQSFFWERNVLIQKAIDNYQIMGESMAASLVNAPRSLDPQFLHGILFKMAQGREIKYVRLVKPDGIVYLSDERGLWGYPFKGSRVKIEETTIIDDFFGQDRIKAIVIPLKTEGESWTLWLGVSLDRVERFAWEALLRNLLLAIILGAVLTIAVYLLVRKIIQPVLTLKNAAELAAQGNLDQKIDIRTGDEIEGLVFSFNKMMLDLKESQSALKESKAVLEVKVSARTKELKSLAESLEAQVAERTKKLQEKVRELERFQQLAVGRELTMIKLKQRLKALGAE